MKALRGIVEDEFTKAADRASREIGTEFASKYKLSKELYADLATARKIAKSEAERNQGANFVSLTDVIVGASGGVKGVAAVVANQVRRKYGNQISAQVLGEASKLLAVQDAAVKMDGALNKGTKTFLEGSKGGIRPLKRVSADDLRDIRTKISSPEAVQARVGDAFVSLRQYAPQTAVAASTAASRVAAWLSQNLPKEPKPTTVSFGPPKTRPLSDTDLQRASQMIEVAEDPSIVLDRLREGRLTRTHVEALKGMHPESYAKVTSYLQEHGAELRQQLPVQQQVALSLLFGQAVNASMQPGYVKAFQATFSGGNQAPAAPNAPPAQGTPVNLPNAPGGTRQTAMSKIEGGE